MDAFIASFDPANAISWPPPLATDEQERLTRAERDRRLSGMLAGAGCYQIAEAQAAGNAVVPQVVEWIARELKLRGTYV